MASQPAGMLTRDDLNDTDERVLDVLRHGRVTPQYVAEQLDVSRTYASERLKRLVEHDHVLKVASGLYELKSDPRLDGDWPTEIGFLRNTEIISDAEDVKTVRLVGDRGTVDVQVTDESMQEFAETAKQVFSDIHGDMNAMRELFDEFSPEDDAE